MTYSNGAFCPHPLANPFNTRLGPANYSLNQLKGVQQHAGVNKSSLEVPNQDVPMFGTPEWEQRYGQANQQELTVPNQDIPAGPVAGEHGFLPGTSFFKCLDGTVIDFKTGKILRKQNHIDNACWGDPDKVIRPPQDIERCHSSDKHELDSIVDAVAHGKMPNFVNDGDDDMIDPASAEYWLRAQEESEKMMASMTDEQKKMIADFEKHFPKSRLIEECKKMSKSLKQI